MKSKKSWVFLFLGVFVISILNMGTVLKKDNPIQKTQTDAIAHKQKMEEIKDGEKGAPTPSHRLYARSEFLTEAPYEKMTPEKPENVVSEQSEVFLPDEEGVSLEEEDSGLDWWTETESDTKSTIESSNN